MEELVDAGLLKAISISNFNKDQIEALLNKPGLKYQPANNQLNISPLGGVPCIPKPGEVDQLAVTPYSPFGSPDRPWVKSDDPSLMEGPVVKAIAEKHKKTPAQILIRFQVQRNVIVIPKSVTPQRIKNNFQVFDFKLSEEDMKTLFGIKRDWRLCPMPWGKKHKDYPFNTEF